MDWIKFILDLDVLEQEVAMVILLPLLELGDDVFAHVAQQILVDAVIGISVYCSFIKINVLFELLCNYDQLALSNLALTVTGNELQRLKFFCVFL